MTENRTQPRAQFVRKRRSSRLSALLPKRTPSTTTRRPYSPGRTIPAVPPRIEKTERRSGQFRQSNGAVRSAAGAHQYAFSLGRADVRAPALAMPRLGLRWLSGLATALLVFLLYTLWASSTFTMTGVELHGSQRLTPLEINAALHLSGQPIFVAVPSKITEVLRSDFPDLKSVRVQVGFPNRLQISVVDRTPVLVWSQDGKTTWIDASGIAFQPRGEASNLIPVSASGTPAPIEVDASTPLYERPFIDPQMVKAMMTLYPYLPQGAPMTFDPQYGMGWQDSRGWSVFFGQNTEDIQMKIKIYQAIVTTLNQLGIQPTLISVEYPDAPFYK